jgi:hypothetical protein
MQQQQLYLLVLAFIVVGLAVAVGIGMFADNSVSANRDAVGHDLVNFALRAHEFYRRPAQQNGGGGSFVGLTADAQGLAKITNLPGGMNANGTYTIYSSGTETEIVLQGVGRESADGSHPVTMRMFVSTVGPLDSLYQVY